MALQFLERAQKSSAPVATRTVYTTDAAAGAAPLSLTELEFIAAAINRHLEVERGVAVPEAAENDLHISTASGLAIQPTSNGANGKDDTESGSPREEACANINDCSSSSSGGLPAFDGGAPFARHCAHVPRVPPYGCRFTAYASDGSAAGSGAMTVGLGRELPVDPRLNFAIAGAYVVVLLYIGATSGSLLWSIISSLCVVYLMLPTHFAMRAADTLAVTPGESGGGHWRLTQHALRQRDAWGNREAMNSMERKTVQSGKLSDLAGAVVRSHHTSFSHITSTHSCLRPCWASTATPLCHELRCVCNDSVTSICLMM